MMRQSYPLKVSCYGRRYEVWNNQELAEILKMLDRRDLRGANKFRVGASWPRGDRTRKPCACEVSDD